ncbi:potassium transporter [Roridomyces roridus]|uniref:Potassium transporter n=1 Tax=Roridomyces roridus TaxID=1738132 RepID=A0AAD7CBB0_9AGAR|nr:potassium transporter [Roridomyces roridus]
MSSPSALENGVHNKKRTAVKLGGAALFLLSFQTLGIIYSDIGTSPLYVLNGIWPASGGLPSEEDIVGGISAIIWALTLIPLIKYVFISLLFGTQEGEGGSYALYQGLYPPEDHDGDLDRTLTGDSYKVASRRSAKISERFRVPLLLWGLFGTALTIADGGFTPAVSVTSAIGGIAVAKPSVSKQITPISICILLVLFFAQRFGTAGLAFTFAPISFVWFLLLAGTGIYNITFHPAIFRAFDPSRAVMLFVRTGDYDILAGVLLCVTGCEAIFANLGQFNATSIRMSFTGFVYPALVLAYLGQGARLIADGEDVLDNIFYRTIPGPANGALFWIVFVFAILATVIASQAMITACFSLCQQLVNMKALPPLKLSYTSDTIQGQVYIPAVNWALMIFTIILVAAFSNLANLTNAYGFAVATVMFSTTVLLSVHMRWVKRWPAGVALAYFILWGFFDGLFWGASLKKVPLGAWVPLMVGVILMIIMCFWTWAKGLEDKFDGANRLNLRHFIHPDIDEKQEDEEAEEEDVDADIKEKTYHHSLDRLEDGKHPLARLQTCAVFHKITRGSGVPHTFVGFVRQWPALPRVVIFLSVSVVPIARVPVEERYAITKVRTVEGFYGVTVYLGFREELDMQTGELIDKICALEEQLDPTQRSGNVGKIRAAARSTTHIAPHYHVVSKPIYCGRISVVVNWLRTYLIEDIYRRLATMFPESGNWQNAEE